VAAGLVAILRRQRCLAFALAILGGLLATELAVPVPWLIGGMTACAVATLAGVPLAGPPAWTERLVRVIIGVSLGPSIAASVVSTGAGLGPIVVTALALVTLTVLGGTWWFERRLGLSRAAAYLAAMPGGLSMLLSMTDGIGERPAVLLAHTVRIVIVVVSISLLASTLGVSPEARPVLASLDLGRAGDWPLVLALIGLFYGVCERVRFPGAHVILTMIATALLAGLTPLAVREPEVLKTVAMLVLGVVLGIEIARGERSRYLATFCGSAVYTVVVMAAGAGAAYGIAHRVDASFLVLFLALAPGGIAEVSLIALALGLDAGLVALVHGVRFLYIVVAGPLGLWWLGRGR